MTLAIRNLRIDIGAAIVNGLFLGMVIPYIAAMTLRLGGTAWDMAIIAASAPASNLLAILWGRLTEISRRVRVIYLFHGIARFMVLGMALTTNATMLVALTLLFFILQGVAMPSYVALMRSIYPDAKRASYMAYVRVSAGLATLVGTYITAAWFNGNYQAAVRIAFVLGVVGIWIFSRIQEPIDIDEQK